MSGPLKDRITVVEQVSHQSPQNERLYPYAHSFWRELESVEQPYERSLTIGNTWIPIDIGWLKGKGLGMLIVRSEEKRNGVTVELGYRGCPYRWEIPPSESFRGTPSDPDELMIRCKGEKAKVTIISYPR